MTKLELVDSRGQTRDLDMVPRRMTLGRALDNDFSFPDEPALSRRHFALEPEGGDWHVEDLGSRNGTLLNGEPLVEKRLLAAGDMIEAGGLRLTFRPLISRSGTAVIFSPEIETDFPMTMVHARLADLSGRDSSVLESALHAPTPSGVPRVQALLEAGRALAAHRPLEEVFPLILDLAVRAVGAGRGVLLTAEGSELAVRASKGGEFRISRVVRQKVQEEGESLLVLDARAEAAYSSSMTMVEQKVRSFMAVPLQTDTQVLGVVYVDSPGFIRPFTPDDLALLTVMANIAAIRIEHARLLEVEQAEKLLMRELSQAAEIQSNLLPADVPEVDGYELAGHSTPCRSVGGDYYDFVPMTQGRMSVLIGDVAGKGLPAALLMASLQARVHTLAEDTDDLGRFVTRINRSLASGCPKNRFITYFMTAIEPASGKFSYANAGHNPAYVVRAGGGLETLSEGGPPLAIFKNMVYSAVDCHLDPEDLLFLYSDGLTEAVSPTGEEFGEARLEADLEAARGMDAVSVVRRIRASVSAFMSTAPAPDDLTLVAVRRVR
jgi:serine phosphatase RsbU (regulator of sigma subunit)